MGTHVIMNGVEYVVEDTGAFARYGVQFDVFYSDHASASAHGHQTWEAYIADSNGSQEVEVTTTREVNRLDVTLTNHNLDAVLRNRMTDKEQEQYDAYNKYYGNRDYLFDLNTIPTGGAGFGYDIPAELPGLTGASYPGEIWYDYMENLHKELPYADFVAPLGTGNDADTESGTDVTEGNAAENDTVENDTTGDNIAPAEEERR
jgi:hypothetical protein